MADALKPHSKEWFVALEKFSPEQAARTRKLLQLAGTREACTFCGDEESKGYRRVGSIPAGAAEAVRLCDHCREIRSLLYGERYEQA
jgi:hypothetical protein